MSLEVLLIPIGIAAIAAIAESRSTDLCEKCRATRIVDVDILHEVLTELDARVLTTTDSRLSASSEWGPLTFQKVGDVWLGRVDNASEEQTIEMIAAVDVTVGQLMRARTARQVVERAEALGYRLIEQTEVDGSLNYVFEEAS